MMTHNDRLKFIERRMHEDLRLRSDDIDRLNYNQRQHLLKDRAQNRTGAIGGKHGSKTILLVQCDFDPI